MGVVCVCPPAHRKVTHRQTYHHPHMKHTHLQRLGRLHEGFRQLQPMHLPVVPGKGEGGAADRAAQVEGAGGGGLLLFLVCVCVWERQSLGSVIKMIENRRERVCMCLSLVRERECVCVCICVVEWWR